MAQHVRKRKENADAASKRTTIIVGAHVAQPQPQPEPAPTFMQRNGIYIASIAAVISIVLFVLSAMRACSLHERIADEVVEEVAENGVVVEKVPLDWNNLNANDGRYAYVFDGQVKSRVGIDVSENQREINWNAVAADGIDFAMIRLGYRGVTEGVLYLDEHYRNNLIGAKLAGVECGVYFFSQARTVKEAVEEADYVLRNLEGMPLEYPIGFDSEDALIAGVQSRTTGLSVDEMTAIAEAFCTRVELAGYRSMIYGNYSDIARYRDETLQKHGVWWAEYDALRPSAQMGITMWQYSNGGDIAGIDAAVDMNIDLSNIQFDTEAG